MLPLNQIIQGDCRKVMRSFPAESIDLVVTSPPYYGLRTYGSEAVAVWGGKPDCEHEWKAGFCVKCGAWRGQLGLEPHPQMYIDHLVEVCREVKRVLKKTGNFYLNLGDTYYSSLTELRKNLPESRLLKPEEAAWLAALIDGEGTIGIQRAKRGLRIYVQVFNQNRELLEGIKQITGFGSISDKATESMWTVVAKSAEIILREVYPYLIVKREQAKVALAFRKTVNAYNRHPKGVLKGTRGGSVGLPDYLAKEREKWYHEIIALNQGKIRKSSAPEPEVNFYNFEKFNWKKALRPKQLLGIPWRVAIALQEDGWILRNAIIWWKPNAMPSSVKDRLNTTYEYIFHFVKQRKYYYNLDAIREPHKSVGKTGWEKSGRGMGKQEAWMGNPQFRNPEVTFHPKGKNPGDVVLTKHDLAVGRVGNFGYTDPLHTKAYNIKGKNLGDVIIPKSWGVDKHGEYHGKATKDYKSAGAQNPSEVKRRIIESFKKKPKGKNPGDVFRAKTLNETFKGPRAMRRAPEPGEAHAFHSKGKNPGDFWSISTKPFPEAHFAVYPLTLCVRPILSSCPPDGVVLDPFAGSGTTCLACELINRQLWDELRYEPNEFARKTEWNLKWIGIEIVPRYVEIAKKRLKPYITQQTLI